MLERVLDRYRLRRPVRDDFTLIDTAGEFVQAQTVAAKILFERKQIKLSQISHALDSSLASFSPVTLPTPGRRRTGSVRRNASTSSGLMTKSPSGLRQSEASFERNLLGATPAEAVRFNSWRICSRIVRATSVAVGKPVLLSVTSKYASSRDKGSIRSVWRLKISRTLCETAR